MRALRELISRLLGTVRRTRRDADLEEELRLHVEMAAEDARRRGDTPDEPARTARLRVGGVPQTMDALRDQRGLPWLDALSSDVVFGWRQLRKHRAASIAAILSLGLAIGATTAAFRLVDAVLLRPLPVTEPDRLFAVATTFPDSEGRPDYQDDFDYPTYREYVKAAADSADVMVVGMAARQPVIFAAGDEPEVVLRQFVSGNVFASLGLQPALGRLFTPADDLTPGAHPIAVVSYDYWTRRFGRDPTVLGKTFRAGSQPLEIVGVAPKGFTGTEPGSVTDVFLPAMMNAQAINSPGWSWFRIWIRPKAGISEEQIRLMLQARFRAVRLLPAASGVSALQKTFWRPLVILGALAAFVLLIACANVANLLTGQAMGRTREMALRVSIGAARWRLIELVLVESALLAIVASVVGTIFAAWSAPFVVSMLAPIERPVRLILDADWRALGFGVALALTVTLLFGLAPAIRASAVDPLGTLKGSGNPHAPRRLTHALMGAQMAFCMFLLFAGGLFVGTFQRLLRLPLGFSDQNLVLVQTESRTKHSPEIWTEVVNHLRETPGVDSAALAGWAPLSGNRWRASVQVDDRPAGTRSPYFLSVSSGYFDTMRVAMVRGRDFRPGETPPGMSAEHQPLAGVGIVSEAFARLYFDGQNPVGKRVRIRHDTDDVPMEIVGLVRDAAYNDVREPMPPTVYVPLEARNDVAFMVRTAGDPLALAPVLRREVSRARPDLRVRAVELQSALVRQQMIRERLLAALSTFFAGVALLLAGIGLYGVLNSAVLRQRREISIRMALGARAAHVVRRMTTRILGVVGVGALVGLAGGLAFGRVVQTLLFQVTPTDAAAFVAPIGALAVAAVLAALPPAIRAVRIDPAQTLRAD